MIAVKDYIQNPKPNGYRSYHMIIETLVFFSDKQLSVWSADTCHCHGLLGLPTISYSTGSPFIDDNEKSARNCSSVRRLALSAQT